MRHAPEAATCCGPDQCVCCAVVSARARSWGDLDRTDCARTWNGLAAALRTGESGARCWRRTMNGRQPWLRVNRRRGRAVDIGASAAGLRSPPFRRNLTAGARGERRVARVRAVWYPSDQLRNWPRTASRHAGSDAGCLCCAGWQDSAICSNCSRNRGRGRCVQGTTGARNRESAASRTERYGDRWDAAEPQCGREAVHWILLDVPCSATGHPATSDIKLPGRMTSGPGRRQRNSCAGLDDAQARRPPALCQLFRQNRDAEVVEGFAHALPRVTADTRRWAQRLPGRLGTRLAASWGQPVTALLCLPGKDKG
jgi:hypothetical protein